MLLRLVGLKECGLGTQSLGLGWTLSEVGTRVVTEEDLFHPSPPHKLGMPSWSGDQAQKKKEERKKYMQEIEDNN